MKNDIHQIFNQENMIYSLQGSGGISTWAKYSIGREIKEYIENIIRINLE